MISRRGFLAVPTLAAAQAPKPNFVVIQVDDLGYADTACYGHPYHRTPNIGRLAREGMKFTQAYSAAPCCSPTRASILTGKYPARLHLTGQPSFLQDPPVRKMLHPPFRTQLPEGSIALPALLKEAGYRCASFGKSGPGDDPKAYGFDDCGNGSLERIEGDAFDFLAGSRAKPFFCYLNPNEVHVPFGPKAGPNAAGSPDSSALYTLLVENVDRFTGRVVEQIERLKLQRSTLVIFTSDNGGFLPYANNGPFREGKSSLYEGGIRVPFVAWQPGRVRAGSVRAEPVVTMDLFATLIDLAGNRAPLNDGASLRPLLDGRRTPKREPVYWHWPHYRRSMANDLAAPSSAIRSGDFKLIHFYEDGRDALYNLSRDPGEASDLAAALPRVRGRLRNDLDRWLKEVDAQTAPRNPAYRA